MTTSRISRFYNLTLEERRAQLADASQLTPDRPASVYERTLR